MPSMSHRAALREVLDAALRLRGAGRIRAAQEDALEAEFGFARGTVLRWLDFAHRFRARLHDDAEHGGDDLAGLFPP